MVIQELAVINLQWALNLAEERYKEERLGPPLVRASTPDGASAPSGDHSPNVMPQPPSPGGSGGGSLAVDQRLAVPPSPVARNSLGPLVLLLGIDRHRRDRSCFEPQQRDRLSCHRAIAIVALVDPA